MYPWNRQTYSVLKRRLQVESIYRKGHRVEGPDLVLVALFQINPFAFLNLWMSKGSLYPEALLRHRIFVLDQVQLYDDLQDEKKISTFWWRSLYYQQIADHHFILIRHFLLVRGESPLLYMESLLMLYDNMRLYYNTQHTNNCACKCFRLKRYSFRLSCC